MNTTLQKAIEIAKTRSAGADEPADLYWLSDVKSGDESDENYCYECAEKQRGLKNNANDIRICGGGSQEDDIPQYCDDCDVLLKVYVLSPGDAIGRLPDVITSPLDFREVQMILECITKVKRGSEVAKFLSKVIKAL